MILLSKLTDCSRLSHRSVHYYLLICYLFQLSNIFTGVLSDRVTDHLDEAKRLLNSGKYSEALPHFDSAIREDPTNLSLFKRATVFLALNRPRSALEDLNRALEMNRDFTPALSQRASLHIKLGNLDEAHIDYENLLRMEPNDQDAIMMYGKVERLRDDIMNAQDLLAEYRFDEAAKSLGQLVDVMPFNTELLKIRAECFEKLGQTRRAINDYRTIAKLTVDALTYLTIAKLYYKMGIIDESLNNVRECLKLDPDHKSCMQFYKPLKKINRHIENMLKSKSSKDNDDCINQAKNAIKLLKQRPSYQDEQQLLPLIYSIQSVMCHCSSQARDIIDGFKYCDEALENSSEGGIEGIAVDKAEVYCDKAELLAENEDYQQALEMYQKSQKLRESRRATDGIERMKKALKSKKIRNYYQILGVDRNAGEKEINKAYRKLAAIYHPDRHQSEEAKKKAQAKFMDLADAKAVLTDPKKRKQYDNGEDPLDPESKQHSHAHQGFYGDPHFAHFGGAPFSFKFNFG